MTLAQLDEKLRSLSLFEKELLHLDQRDVRQRFSTQSNDQEWRINNEKLMLQDEEIAIHKHDRFIAFSNHSHDYLELMFVYSGKIDHIIDGEAITLHKGELLLMDMNTSHSILPAGEEDIALNILMKKEFFDTFFLRQIAHNNRLSNFIVNALYNDNEQKQYLYFRSVENQTIWQHLVEILIEYYDQELGVETAVRAHMMLVFNELIRNYHRYLSKSVVDVVDHSIALDLMAYIDEHYKELSLSEMAKVFNYNSDYLGKQIKRLTGSSLKSLVKKRKLNEAAKLLRNTDLSVTEILEQIHYSNASYFYQQFKDKYKMTPDDYRHA